MYIIRQIVANLWSIICKAEADILSSYILIRQSVGLKYLGWPLCRNLYISKAVLNTEQCSIGNQWRVAHR